MNDRFKFRYVYEDTVYDVVSIDFDHELVFIEDGFFEMIRYNNLLQCTGLKDKNGKLIYEGDIVRFYDDTICIIKWDNESGMFCTLDTEGQAMIGVPKYYEVLGNIYENPELAKEIKATWKSKEEKNNG